MRLIPACFIVFLFLLAFPVQADYQKAYSDYSFVYTQYRTSHDEYLVAKSTYATYRTLTAQNEAITKLRAVLHQRNKLMSAYYDLLQEKLAATPNISPEAQKTFFAVKESEKAWLDQQKIKIEAASSLEDLNSISADFTVRYPQMDVETKQAVGVVLLAKEDSLADRWDSLASRLSDELKVINSAGEETGIGERGIISARNKKDLGVEKIAQAQKTIYATDYQGVNLLSAQQKLAEASQYFREATDFLLEVIKSITG